MQKWLRQQLAELDHLESDPRDPFQDAHDLADLVREAERRAAVAGLLDAVVACQIRPGPVGTELARRVLLACLAALPADCVADSLLNLQQAADYLGYKPSGLRKVVKRGDIRFVQVGQGPIKFRREWLDEFVANVNAPTPPAKKRQPPTPPIDTQFGFDPSLLNI